MFTEQNREDATDGLVFSPRFKKGLRMEKSVKLTNSLRLSYKIKFTYGSQLKPEGFRARPRPRRTELSLFTAHQHETPANHHCTRGSGRGSARSEGIVRQRRQIPFRPCPRPATTEKEKS